MTEVAPTDMLDELVDAAVTYQTPEAFMIGTVLIGALIALLVAGLEAKVLYEDHLKAVGKTKAEEPFGADYLIVVVLVAVLGGFAGYILTGILLGLCGHQDAPAMVYYCVAFLVALMVGKYGHGFLNKVPDSVRNKLKLGGGDDGSVEVDAETSTTTSK